MSNCTRCGSKTVNRSEPSLEYSQYLYCDDCHELFSETGDNGVRVKKLGEDEENRFVVEPSDELEVNYEVNTEETETIVDAMAVAKLIMEDNDAGGVFHDHENGSIWLIDEYFEMHTKTKKQVEKEMKSRKGFFRRLFG